MGSLRNTRNRSRREWHTDAHTRRVKEEWLRVCTFGAGWLLLRHEKIEVPGQRQTVTTTCSASRAQAGLTVRKHRKTGS